MKRFLKVLTGLSIILLGFGLLSVVILQQLVLIQEQVLVIAQLI